jgi:hypothetical protein
MAQQRVDITKLGLSELQDLQEQLTNEVNTFMQNIVALQQTAGRFATAGQSIEYLSEQKQGQPVLLPLTESLYVSGTLESVETVLLEIGTGYFVEVCAPPPPPPAPHAAALAECSPNPFPCGRSATSPAAWTTASARSPWCGTSWSS